MDAASVVEEETQLGNKHFDSLFQLVESNEPVQCITWLCELCDNFVLATLLTEDIADLPGQMQLFGGDPSLRSAIHTIAHACRAVSIHSPSGKEARCLGAYAFEVFNRLRAEMALLNGIPSALRNYTMPKVFETSELSKKGVEGLRNVILSTITEMQADGSLDVQLGADASYWLQSCGAAQSGALSNWFGWLLFTLIQTRHCHVVLTLVLSSLMAQSELESAGASQYGTGLTRDSWTAVWAGFSEKLKGLQETAVAFSRSTTGTSSGRISRDQSRPEGLHPLVVEGAVAQSEVHLPLRLLIDYPVGLLARHLSSRSPLGLVLQVAQVLQTHPLHLHLQRRRQEQQPPCPSPSYTKDSWMSHPEWCGHYEPVTSEPSDSSLEPLTHVWVLTRFHLVPEYGTVLADMCDPDEPGKKDVIHFTRLWDPPEVAQEPDLSTVYVDVNRRLVLRPDDTVYLENGTRVSIH